MKVQDLYAKLQAIPVYQNLSHKQPSRYMSLIDIFRSIKIEPRPELRKAREAGKGSEAYDVEKQRTLAVKLGFLDKGREIKDAEAPSGLIVMDIDEDEIQEAEAEGLTYTCSDFMQLPYVVAAWRSFGGVGMGILVYAKDVTAKNHEEFYHAISHDIYTKLGLICDPACASPNRAVILSSDPNAEFALPEWDVESFTIRKYNKLLSDEANNVFKVYNNDADTTQEVFDLLLADGWKQGRRNYWSRPGKNGVSAQWNETGERKNTFKVFSSNADLEPKLYDKASLLSELKFGGNMKETSKYLYELYPTVKDAIRRNAAEAKKQAQYIYNPDFTSVNRTRKKQDSTGNENIDKLIECIEQEAGTELKSIVSPEYKNGFDLFPPRIANMLRQYSKTTGAMPEYVINAALYVVSTVSLGKISMQVDPVTNYREWPVYWGVSLGRPGAGKSFPHKHLNYPLTKIQSGYAHDFNKAKEDYEADLEFYNENKKVREATGLSMPKPPDRMRVLFATASTMEGNYKALEKQGYVSKFYDEFMSFFKEHNMYRGGAGNDTEITLSMFNSSPITRNLASNQLHIDRPFMPISGTGIFEMIASEIRSAHTQDGMYERILYFINLDNRKQPKIARSSTDLNNVEPVDLTLWNVLIDNMHNEINYLQSEIILTPDSDAIKYLEDVESRLNNIVYDLGENGKDKHVSLFSKIRMYFYRFQIIFWMLRVFENGGLAKLNGHYSISALDVENAKYLVDYIINTYYYMLDTITGANDPNVLSTRELSDYRRALARTMHDKHPEATFTDIAEAINVITGTAKPISRTTISRWLNKKN